MEEMDRLLFPPGTRGHCLKEILISDRNYPWNLTYFVLYSLNITVFNQMYEIQLIIRHILTCKGSMNAQVMPKCLCFSQKIYHVFTHPQEVTRKITPWRWTTSKLWGWKLANSFILAIQNDLEDDKIQIILEEVRNVLLSSLEDMEETKDFLIR